MKFTFINRETVRRVGLSHKDNLLFQKKCNKYISALLLLDFGGKSTKYSVLSGFI